MTNGWNDIKNADVVLVMGGNAAEAHTCGFKWVTEAKAHNGAKLIVVDPRFTRTAAVSDLYAPLRPGTDIAFLGGVINYLLSSGKIFKEYVAAYTNAAYIVKEGFGFEDGLFTGYNAEKRDYDRSTWDYEYDEAGNARLDPTLENPRCVLNLLKAHYSRYTPAMVERTCGTPADLFQQVCEIIATTANGSKSMTSMYALGWTQHSKGSQNIRNMAIIQLLLGNIGVPGGGINALRGHANVQGITDFGLFSPSVPGYMAMPKSSEATLEDYLKTRAFKPIRPDQMSYWQNYRKFFVSFLKAMYGKNATAENQFGYDWLPKVNMNYEVLRVFEMMFQGKLNGYVCQGFNPLMSMPNRKKLIAGLSKLKFLVVIDPVHTETAHFFENHGEMNDADPSKIDTEVFLLPAATFAEDDGTFTNSGRVIQWHWKAAEPPAQVKNDNQIIADLFLRLKALYAKEGGAFPEPIMNLSWSYRDPADPTAEELLREINGVALSDLPDADPTKPPLKKAGELLDLFGQLKDDGSTSCANWIYSGCYTEKGNLTARRNPADPSGKGIHPNWGYAWPANRRILYNRASADPSGKAWSARKKVIEWNGSKWAGIDVPDFGPAIDPTQKATGPFIMNPEGVGRLFTRALMKEGPFPEHYEPFESPVANPFHPKVQANPVARVFKGDMEVFGKPEDFPYVGTTYRLTEHFHFWSKHSKLNAILQPEMFVEIGEALAKEKGIAAGDWVEVSSNRARIKAKAVVTKRIRPLMCDGKPVHVVGIPLHWGFVGATKKGFGANQLTPYVGDANTETPEFKAFLVNVKRIGPAA
jgi:formate dehydrogenase major subunit